MRQGFGTVQCLICLGWYHYKEDHDICRSCYQMFKKMEIYDIPNKLIEFGEEE
jgi:hypothetical protein